MAVTAGALSRTLVNQTTALLASAVATGGTGPYTYQWYYSTTSGFTPGAGNIISGATSLTLSTSALLAGTQYYFKVIATDTGASNATSTATQLSVLTESGQNQNQFVMTQITGMVDLRVGPTNVISAQVDVSVTTQIYPGQGVKFVTNTVGGVPRVAPVAANSDQCIGFAVFNIKDQQYTAAGASSGQNLEIAMWGSVVWCWATGAITQGAEACLDVTYVGGVQATGATATIMGWALDGCSAAGAIRVMLLPNVGFTTA